MKRAALAFLLFLAVPLAAQSPEMIARVKATIAALNGTPEDFESYAQQAYAPSLLGSTTPQQRRELQARIRNEFGDGFDVNGLLRVGPSRVKIQVEGPKKPGVLLFDHDAPPELKIAGLAIDGGAVSAPEAPVLPPAPIDAAMNGEQLARAIDPYLAPLVKDDRFSGAVLIARDGKPVFAKGYGLANRSDNVPATPQTRFNVGSINKQFTKVAIGQLAAAGKLALDDPIGEHLADHPNDAAKKATIDQLLNHRGGIADWMSDPEFQNASKGLFRTNRDFYRLVAPKPLEFEPGAREQYCNSCYVVLGEIVERVSGMPYERYIEQNVLARAGMKTIGLFQTDDPVPQVAVGYTRDERGLRSNLHVRGAGPSAAGGAFATPADLLAFEQAMRAGKLLDPKWTAWYLRNGAQLNLGGGGNGVSSMLLSNGTWTVVAMANLDTPAGSSVARALFQALTK